MRSELMLEEPEAITNFQDDAEIPDEAEEPQNVFPPAESLHSHESIEGASTNSQEPVHENGYSSHLVGSPHGSILEDESDTVDSSEEDEDEEDEDEEPALKYEKLGGSAQELLEKDTASALAVAVNKLAMGMHSGVVHILDLHGKRSKSYRPHTASVNDISFDSTGDFVATASIDGQVIIHSLSTPESYAFDLKRPMRTIALGPNFAKNSSRSFVCGGMAGNLVLYEKGWLGHKETILHTSEGPIWSVRWRETLIAWANDMGVKIYDTETQTRITYIERRPNSPRADLFKCTLLWQDDSTLVIGWADCIQVARVRTRPNSQSTSHPLLMVEITAVFELDCMISGIVPHFFKISDEANSTTPSSFLVLAYIPPDTSFSDEATDDRRIQARKPADRPELRIISRGGEELSSDILSLTGYQTYGCNDYILAEAPESSTTRCYFVLSPKGLIIVRPRDKKDHIAWLVERKRYEEALDVIETMGDDGMVMSEIGQQYIGHLLEEGDYAKAAQLSPKILGSDRKRWEDWIFVFAQQKQLHMIIPYIPVSSPQLDRVVYEMILAHYIVHDEAALLKTIQEWPTSIYDVGTVIVVVQSELESNQPNAAKKQALMQCLAKLYLFNRQPGRALPYLLRLHDPTAFDLIRENNLFTAVQDQALLLVEFDQELMRKRKAEGQIIVGPSPAIKLLVDHTHSIPVPRVVQQLQSQPYFFYLYLDALFAKDPLLASDYADSQVGLQAEYNPTQLLDFLRASNYYSLESAYTICKGKDLVPEMVFLLGKMGNNKEALNLIIERLGDVHRAIDFAKEQNDDDLWEDLLRYSETKPAFIRGLLENVGAEIDPIRLIRRIKNGLEIPGLKDALIKILHDYNLQISLLEGCQTVMEGDATELAKKLQVKQTKGFLGSSRMMCPICSLPLLTTHPRTVVLLFLCRHVVHAGCVRGGDTIPVPPDRQLTRFGVDAGIDSRVAFEAIVRGRIRGGCPVCHKREEGLRS